MKLNIKRLITDIIQGSVIAAITLFAVSPLSCKVSTQGIQILAGDYTPPVLNEYTVTDSTTLHLDFSESITISGGVVSPVLNDYFSSNEHSSTQELSPSLLAASGEFGSLPIREISYGSTSADIHLEKEMQVGQKYEFYAKVKDTVGNSLTFSIPFTGYNPCIPNLIFTEIKASYAKGTTKVEKEKNFYRNEYVEFLTLSDGNLAGLSIVSGNDGEEKAYTFPPIEVTAGQIFVVHLRNAGEGCISEEGDDLTLATTTYTSPTVRDLWGTQTSALLGDKTDILLLKNPADGKIMDAIMYRDESITEWSEKLLPYAELVEEAQIYEGQDAENAALTTGITSTKSLQRVDAASFLEKIKAGNQIEYPLKGNPGAWMVASANAGTLE